MRIQYSEYWINLTILGCLFHGKDTCPDCMFEQLCGETPKTNQCSFMKQSEMTKVVQAHTAEIKGTDN